MMRMTAASRSGKKNMKHRHPFVMTFLLRSPHLPNQARLSTSESNLCKQKDELRLEVPSSHQCSICHWLHRWPYLREGLLLCITSCPTQRPMNFGEHFCIQSCIRNMYDPRIILCKNLSSFSRWCKGIVKSLLPACMHKPQDCQACHKVWKATRFSSCINQKVKALGKDRCGPNQISRYDLWIIAPAEGPCGGFEHPVGASKEWASQVFMSLSTCSVHTKAIFAAFKLKSPEKALRILLASCAAASHLSPCR